MYIFSKLVLLIFSDFSSNMILPSKRPTNLSEYFFASSTWWGLHRIVVPNSLLIFFNKDKIKKAVLEAHQHGEIGGYGGKMSHYMEVKDSDYNVLREVIELLNKNKS